MLKTFYEFSVTAFNLAAGSLGDQIELIVTLLQDHPEGQISLTDFGPCTTPPTNRMGFLSPFDKLLNQGQVSLNEALINTEVEYRYELSLGTLINNHGKILSVTHDHWGSLDTLGMVQFRNAAGDPLLELHGDTFKELIRYQDGGKMILGRDAEGDHSGFLSALGSISQAEYNQRIKPAELRWANRSMKVKN